MNFTVSSNVLTIDEHIRDGTLTSDSLEHLLDSGTVGLPVEFNHLSLAEDTQVGE
jgi:hypothetical protein